MAHDSLHHAAVEINRLDAVAVERMFQLMADHYDCVRRDQFEADLEWKDRAILLLDSSDEIQGFSTVAVNPKDSGGPDYDVFYSGDTIIHRDYWGTQELVKGFSMEAGRSKAEGRRLLWMLLSKGHRTYSYLPLFAQRYYPAADPDRDAHELRPILADCAAQLFGEAWKPERGVVKFAESLGQLKPELSQGTAERATQKHVRFFLEQNPGYATGDELVCMTELEPANLRRHVRQYFLEGMAQREMEVRS